ncbi:glycosyltransferase [Paenibacillus sp. UNC451MF]|uniref:glycosyltransferase n=1 Tax=Paenibacillus sp. UNC451MF TaxID=1449063 RepID=UPI00068A8D4A|nr:glycosyltransferase [Paenibacillus sp. UNC451MF]
MDEAALGAERIVQSLHRRDFDTAELLSIQYVKAFPAVAQGWFFLAQSLLERHHGAMAQLAFQRAWLLDPEANWVQSVYAALKQSQSGPVRQDIIELLKIKLVTVTAAIMVKNEERCIERCLRCLIGAVDEIVVMDTGSTDRTLDIVRQFPEVKLYETEWQDSFSQLRNEILPLLTSDWVLWVDADEVLHQDDARHLREIAGIFDDSKQPVILQVWMANQYGRHYQQDFSQSRMFSLRHGLRYFGRIHEQIVPPGGLQERVNTISRKVRIRLIHDGYDPAIWKSRLKSDRSMKLLQLMVEEEPLNPSGWFFYGRECFSNGEQERAFTYLQEAERLAQDAPGFSAIDTVRLFMVKIHLQRQEWEAAMRLCTKILWQSPDYPDAHYHLAQAQVGKARALVQQAKKEMVAYNEAIISYRGATTPDPELKAWKAGLHMAELAVRSCKLAEAKKLLEYYAQRYPDVEALQTAQQHLEGIIHRLLDGTETGGTD